MRPTVGPPKVSIRSGVTTRRPAGIARPSASATAARFTSRDFTRPVKPAEARSAGPAPQPESRASDHTDFSPDPYEDYALRLTAEGSIHITYKTYDERLRRVFAAIFLWFAATSVDACVLLLNSPVSMSWIKFASLVLVAIINAAIVRTRFQVYRTIEVTSDGLILDGVDTFLLSKMEVGWPTFGSGPDGGQTLAGIYGTRHVDYLTVWHMDEFDRGPDVLKSHLAYAMQQLWSRPY